MVVLQVYMVRMVTCRLIGILDAADCCYDRWLRPRLSPSPLPHHSKAAWSQEEEEEAKQQPWPLALERSVYALGLQEAPAASTLSALFNQGGTARLPW